VGTTTRNRIEDGIFLINPTRHKASLRVLKKILKKETSAEIIEAGNRQELCDEVVKFCKGPKKYLIIWGGDGTVHNAINAMMIHPVKGKALGFLRGGTGNGIQDSYEIPWRINKQIETYISSAEHSYYEAVDLLKIETEKETFYGQLFGIGVDAEILKVRKELHSDAVNRIIAPGIRYYLSAGIRVLKYFDFRALTGKTLTFSKGKYALKGAKINAEYPFESFVRTTHSPLIEIGTRPYYGKLFKICPDVVCNDGKMDAYLFQFHSRFSAIKNLASVWNGWHDRINSHLVKAGHPLIERYEVESAHIQVSKPSYFHVDGELYHTGEKAEIRISILPRIINFLVPEHFYLKFHPHMFEKSKK